MRSAKMDEDIEDYDEDFEEYESDFEDSEVEDDGDAYRSSSKAVAVKSSGIIMQPTIVRQKASDPAKIIEKSSRTEFLRISTRSSTFLIGDVNDPLPVTTIPTSRSFINFESAVKEQEKKKLCNKVLKRSSEVLEFIALDEMTYEVFEIPPMQYDTFIKSFGKSNTNQMCIQTGNTEEEEIQTDEIFMFDKWTQNPPYDNLGVGGDSVISMDELREDLQSHFKIHAIKLQKFLQNVIPMMLTLLKETIPHVNVQSLTKPDPSMIFTQGFFRLEHIPICESSPVIYISYSPGHVAYILSVHGNYSKLPFSAPVAEEKGIICIWNVCDYDKPEFILTANSSPTCACFGPSGFDTVIAGMIDGSLMLWDLTESSSLHQTYKYKNSSISLRSPTFNTAAVVEECHCSCVASVQALQYLKRQSQDLKELGNQTKDYRKSYHVLSLEDMGVLNIWVVMEGLDFCSTESDFGLAPGGKVKLVWSSSVLLKRLIALPEKMGSDIRTFDFRTLGSNHIVIATDVNLVLHLTRNGQNPVPKHYSCMSALHAEIRCITSYPHDEEYFLVGSADGSVMLFNKNRSSPLRTIPQAACGESITCLQWSPTHPTLFYVLDSSSSFHIWDLSQNTLNPKHSYTFSTTKILWFTIYDFIRKKGKTKGDLPSQIAFARDDGSVEVHSLHWKFDVISEKEYRRQIEIIKKL